MPMHFCIMTCFRAKVVVFELATLTSAILFIEFDFDVRKVDLHLRQQVMAVVLASFI